MTACQAGRGALDAGAMTYRPTILSPEQVRQARAKLGLSAAGLAQALQLGANGGRTVRRWEAGECPCTGPAVVAIELLLRDRAAGDEAAAARALVEILRPILEPVTTAAKAYRADYADGPDEDSAWQDRLDRLALIRTTVDALAPSS